MCNGTSVRQSQGGSIAVLRPTNNQLYFDDIKMTEEWRLFFSNHNDEESEPALGTHVEFNGLEDLRKAHRGGCWVVIHHDGDLSAPTVLPLNQPSSNAFFSFQLMADAPSIKRLPQRLDLGVGDTGIIGRKVSVMTGSSLGPVKVAEGIVGWN